MGIKLSSTWLLLLTVPALACARVVSVQSVGTFEGPLLYASADGRYAGYQETTKSGRAPKVLKDSSNLLQKRYSGAVWGLDFSQVARNRIVLYLAVGGDAHYDTFRYVVVDTLGREVFASAPSKTDLRLIFSQTGTLILAYPAVDYVMDPGGPPHAHDRTSLQILTSDFKPKAKLSVAGRFRSGVLLDSTLIWVDDDHNVIANTLKNKALWLHRVPKAAERGQSEGAVELPNGDINTLVALGGAKVAVINHADHVVYLYDASKGLERTMKPATRKGVQPAEKTVPFGYEKNFLLLVNAKGTHAKTSVNEFLETILALNAKELAARKLKLSNDGSVMAALPGLGDRISVSDGKRLVRLNTR